MPKHHRMEPGAFTKLLEKLNCRFMSFKTNRYKKKVKGLLLCFSLAVVGLEEVQFNLKSNVNTLQNVAW